MLEKLILELRKTEDKLKKKEIAIQLALIKDPRAVDELIKMANGEVYSHTKRSLKTLFMRLPLNYEFEDQLIGLEALSKTSSPKALEFLKKITKAEIVRSYNVIGDANYQMEGCYYEVHSFPQSSGRLKYELEIKVLTGREEHDTVSGGKSPVYSREKSEIERDLSLEFENHPIHKLIRSSVSELEGKLRFV